MYEPDESINRSKRRRIKELPELIEHLSLHQTNDDISNQSSEVSEVDESELSCSSQSSSSLVNSANEHSTPCSSPHRKNVLTTLLEHHDVFAKFEKSMRNRLIEDMQRYEFYKGQIIQSSDQPHDQFFIIEHGTVSADGQILSAGNSFGDWCLHISSSNQSINTTASSLVVAVSDHVVMWSVEGALVRQQLLIADESKRSNIMHFLKRLRVSEPSTSNIATPLNSSELDTLAIECDLIHLNQGDCVTAPEYAGYIAQSVLIISHGELAIYRSTFDQSIDWLRLPCCQPSDVLIEGCIVCSNVAFSAPIIRPAVIIPSFDAPRHPVPVMPPRTRKRAREEGMCVNSTILSTILEDDAQQPERPSTPPTTKVPYMYSDTLSFSAGKRSSPCMKTRPTNGVRTRSVSLINAPSPVFPTRNIGLSPMRRSESSPSLVTNKGLCSPSSSPCNTNQSMNQSINTTVLCHSSTATMLSIPLSVLKLPCMKRFSQYLARNVNQCIALC